MAKKSQIVKSKRSRRSSAKFSTRIVRRCWKCGRNRAYMRDFDLCRMCFRELANKGEIPGVKKASW